MFHSAVPASNLAFCKVGDFLSPIAGGISDDDNLSY